MTDCRRVLASALLLFVACRGGGQEDVVAADTPVEPIVRIAPVFTITLRAEGSAPLDPREILETDSALYLLDGRSDELWMVALRLADRTPRLVGSLRQFGQRRVFALASHPQGIGAIGADGILRLMADTAPSLLVHTWRVAEPMRRPLALGATSDGGWLLALSFLGVLPGGVMPFDSTVVVRIDPRGSVRRVWSTERVGLSRPRAFIADRMGGIVVVDTVTLVGAEPARVITVTDGGAWTDTLLGAPRRALGVRERDGLAATRSGPGGGLLRSAALPVVRPVALAARRLGIATVVSAQAGETHLSLDLYCDLRFRETLLETTDLSQLHLGRRGVVALRDHSDDGYVELAFYSWAPLAGRCVA